MSSTLSDYRAYIFYEFLLLFPNGHNKHDKQNTKQNGSLDIIHAHCLFNLADLGCALASIMSGPKTKVAADNLTIYIDAETT